MLRGRNRDRGVKVFATAPASKLAPAAGWTGVAGTGYGVAPVSPTRTKAQPGAAFIDAPNRRFTANFNLCVMADALGGIAKVRFYLEGNTVDVASPGFDTVTDANGNSKLRYGWICPVNWAAMTAKTATGEAFAYAEVFSNDATFQNIVIGPFRVYNAATEYSITKTVAPTGADFVTLDAAQNAYNTNIATWGTHPEFRIITSGDYTFAGANVTLNNNKGWVTVTCAASVIASLTSGGTRTYIRAFTDGLRFKGSGWQMDLNKFSFIMQESTGNLGQLWFDGITVKQTGGKATLYFGNPPNQYWVSPATGGTPMLLCFTDCNFTDTYNAINNAVFARGNTSDGTSDDFITANQTGCYQFNTTTSVNPGGAAGLRTLLASLNITYVGAGTATITVDGASNTAGLRTLTALVNAVSVGTLTLTNPGDNTFTTWAAVAAFFNGLASWAATVPGTARGMAHSWTAAGLQPTNTFPTATITAAATTIYSSYDVHGDGIQVFKSGQTLKNFLFHFNSIKGVSCANGCQAFFLDSDIGLLQDAHFGQNEFATDGSTVNAFSQMSGAQDHVTFHHGTIYGQDLLLRTSLALTTNALCKISQSAFDKFAWNTTPTATLVIDRVNAAINALPSGTTNSTTATTLLYVNAPTDFSPGANMPAGVGARAAAGAWNLS
jgi:hypothetical protein